MNHNHKHSCECRHEFLKYCPTCQVVHCRDCNIEFTRKYPNYYNYSITPSYGGTFVGGYKTVGNLGVGSEVGSTGQSDPNMVGDNQVTSESTKKFVDGINRSTEVGTPRPYNYCNHGDSF